MADITLLHKLEAAVFHLQEPTNEMGVALQTVQGTTYDGIIRFLNYYDGISYRVRI